MKDMKRLKTGKLVLDIQALTHTLYKSKTDLNLLTEKGVYPYDYMNSWNKFDETKLPKKVNYMKKT